MKILRKIKEKLSFHLSNKQKVFLLILSGAFVGLGALFLYLLRAHTYLADNPSACVNCHIMTPYYATWSRSSHARDATCNDCHVPHDNFFHKWHTEIQYIMQRHRGANHSLCASVTYKIRRLAYNILLL